MKNRIFKQKQEDIQIKNKLVYKNNGCRRCGTLESEPATSGSKKKDVYWVATWKNNLDFAILNSNLEYTFLTVGTPSFPKTMTKMYDIYCTKCFDELYDEQHQ